MLKKKILCVEDDASVRKGLERFLRSCGYDPVVAIDAEKALLVVTEMADIWLVITDLNLGGPGSIDREGLNLIEEIKKIRPSLRIILNSGDMTPHVAEQALRNGAEAAIEKTNLFSHLKDIGVI